MPGSDPSAVFAALADPNRRYLLEQLSVGGPLSATDLAEHLPISRQAVVKHLTAMASAGLLTSDRQGREVLFSIQPASLQVAGDWLDKVGRSWDRRLVRLVKKLTPAE